MKVGVHYTKGGFTERWVDYCINNQLEYVFVDCYETNIINVIKQQNITHLMWHLNHESHKDIEYGLMIMNAIDLLGVKTFPNYQSRWHFDNKVVQKYLLESISAPITKSYVFYNKQKALGFLEKADFPIVSKLKRGAGSSNVKLIHNYHEGEKYVNKLFGEGVFATSKAFENLNQKIRVAKKIKNPLELSKKFFRYIKKNKQERQSSALEKGYVYFQDFLNNNDYDTRIIVVGDKAFGIRRFNRKGDFRASGSGILDYSVGNIDVNFVKIAFEVSRKLNTDCLGFDFVYNEGQPNIIEVCFGFSVDAYNDCEGYWDENLNFIKGKFNPQYFMIEDFVKNE
ncbi:hypothetical protein Q763_00660 [Flavobacterium beibuense F44-8]|uniref:ATP-grasp domain-containing protein n=1 Tax=Flavobacterium beibuense F44-8 TaxID=1406840 RepID=A0A0A2LWC9_9FLAO|nr:hypothetical protein [Flavobacterium beibuense]KGO84289.1 hypothetical protein Q763_00660 [Flavobacterium beibuense F44-8]